MTPEEIGARMSLNTGPFSKAIVEAKRQMREFREEGESGFVHAERSGRAFHKLVERVTEASPAMGSALKFALNTTAGAIGLASLALAVFQNQMEKFNKRMDEMRDRNAKPFGDITKSLKEAREHITDINEKVRQFNEKLKMGQNPTEDELKEQKSALDEFHRLKTQVRDIEAEQEKRRLDDAFKLAMQHNDDLFKFRRINSLKHEANQRTLERQHDLGLRSIEDRRKADNLKDEQEAIRKQIAFTRQARDQMMKSGEAAERERDAAQKNATNPTRAVAIRSGAEREAELANLVKELEGKIPELAEKAAFSEAHPVQAALSPEYFHPLGPGGNIADFRRAQQELEHYRKLLDHVRESNRKNTEDEKNATTQLDLKNEELKKYVDSYNQLNEEVYQLKQKQRGPDSVAPASDGGIPYRPLIDKLAPIAPVTKLDQAKTADDIKGLNDKMFDLLKAATQDGLKIQVPD